MLACSITVCKAHSLLNTDDFIPAFLWRLASNYQFNSSSGHLKKKLHAECKTKPPRGFTSVIMLHEIRMDHVTQHMPTAFPFKSSKTESSRQTQCKTMGTLREDRLGNDLYKYIWVHPFAAMITRMLFRSWKLTVRPLPPKCQAKRLVACNLLFRQSLPSVVPQSEQEGKAKSNL